MLLTEQEIEDVAIFIMNKDTFDMKTLWLDFARAIEFAVLEKIKAQGPADWAAMSEEGIVEALGFNQSRSRFTSPLYRLPEGD